MPTLRTNIRLDEAIEKYLTRIKNEGQSDRSIYTARYALRRMQKAVASRREPNPYLHLITAAMMDDYCYGVDGIRANIKAISFNRYRSVLKVFFDYAINMRWCDTNPMSAISPARPDMPTTRLLLSATELLALLDYAANPIERIGLSLGMNTGLRGNDIRHLTIFDANLPAGVIQTEIRKTKKLDDKPITMELHRELVHYLKFYAAVTGLSGPEELPNEWLLMPSYRRAAPGELDKRVKPRPLRVHTNPWRMVQRPLAKMGYPTKGEGFHTLRRSSARALFEKLRESGEGRDHALLIVKEFLNHTNVSQTEHYLGIQAERAIRDKMLRGQTFLGELAESERARINDGGNVERLRHHG